MAAAKTVAAGDAKAVTDPAATGEYDLMSTIEDLETTLDDLRGRVAALRATLGAEIETTSDEPPGAETTPDSAGDDAGSPPFEDPELIQKVAHACLTDDEITEAEERRILRVLLTA